MDFADQLAPTATLVSAKRTAHERRGLHRWHPYYAGYAEAFVESALKYLECKPGMVVLDPWAGSGTTCVVASRAGSPAVGIDINPVMATFTAAKSSCVLGVADTIRSFFNESPLYDQGETTDDDPLLSRFQSQTAGLIRSIWKRIDAIAWPSYGEGVVSPEQAFMHAVVFVALRQLASVPKMSNPTWVGQHAGKAIIDPAKLREGLIACADHMLQDLEQFYRAGEFPREIRSFNASVADMPIVSGSIDRIITSPPYLTRIDYAVATSPELALLGGEELVKDVRHSTTGAPVITTRPKVQRPEWGALCNSVLDRVKTHSSKAAHGYYWKNMTQYFEDIHGALLDIWRVLKPGGSGLVVVQSSYFKEVKIPLGEIYVEMASQYGFQASIAYRDVVKNHMAHVNTRSNEYLPHKVFFEDAVLIRKPA